jgi:hypothetical protein
MGLNKHRYVETKYTKVKQYKLKPYVNMRSLPTTGSVKPYRCGCNPNNPECNCNCKFTVRKGAFEDNESEEEIEITPCSKCVIDEQCACCKGCRVIVDIENDIFEVIQCEFCKKTDRWVGVNKYDYGF